MNIIQIFPAFAAFIYIVLFGVTNLNRPLSRQQKLFLAFLIAAASWSASDFLLRSPFFEQYKLVLFRFVIITSLFWVVQIYYLCRAFLNLGRDFGVYLGYTVLAACVILGFLGIMPPAVTVSVGEVNPVFGWWVLLWVTPPVISAIMGIIALAKRIRMPISPEERNKIGYLICAILLLVVFSVTGATSLSSTVPLTSIGMILCATVLTYAVVRADLISLSVFLRRLLGWISLFIISVVAFELIQIISHFIAGLQLNVTMIVSTTIGTFTVTAILFWLRPLFLEKIDQLFYRNRYRYRRELLDFVTHKIRGVFNLQELGEGLLPPLSRTLDCQQAYLLLPEKDSGNFIVRFSDPPGGFNDNHFQIKKGSPIISYLYKQYLTRKDFDIRPEFRGVWTAERTGITNASIELLFPLLNRGNLVGILALGRKHNGKYSVEDANLVENIANQVAVSLEKEHFQSELAKREKELSIINRLTAVITSSLNINDVYNTFITELRKVVDIDFAAICIVENDKLRFSAVYNNDGMPWNVGDSLELKGSGFEEIMFGKKSIVNIVPDSGNNSPLLVQLKQSGIRSTLLLPLITKDEAFGVLSLASYIPDAYNSERVQLLEQLASQIATSVANAQLYAGAEKRARIDELTKLSNRRHFDETIDKEIHRHFRYGSMLSLIIIDVDNFKSYNDLMGHVSGDKLLQKVAQIINSSVRNIDMTFRYGGDEFAIILPNTSVDSGFGLAERVRKNVEEGTKGEPILISLSLGIAGWPNDGITTQELITAADQALYHAKRTGQNRVCLATKLLPSDAEESDDDQHLEKETLNTIYALAATIEARDRYTYGHSRKVRTYAVELAEAINLPPETVVVISHAALLHDIGKIGIYDTILNKPGALNQEERNLIKSHPELSRTIVAHIPNLTPCLPAIYHHHERWDGNGYPSGLKEEKIPIEARVLTIADSFDAMTSARPYRSPMPMEKVIAELRHGAGSQFDPNLIEAFIPIAIKAMNQYQPV